VGNNMEDQIEVKKTILQKLLMLIERGNRLLVKPNLNYGIVKGWLRGIRITLLKIYEIKTPAIEDIKRYILLPSDTKPYTIIKEILVKLETYTKLLERAWKIKGINDHINPGVNKIFLGHGRNPAWNRIYMYLKDELGYDVEAFETHSRVSSHIIEILNNFLTNCDVAVIVMTPDDSTSEGTSRARQNVIHEIGLFQGRFGFKRVIVFQQANIEEFSNISGLQVVRFHDDSVEGFYELRRALANIE